MRLDNRRGTAGLAVLPGMSYATLIAIVVMFTAVFLILNPSNNNSNNMLSSLGIAESSSCGIVAKGQYDSAIMKFYNGDKLASSRFGTIVAKDWTGTSKTGFLFECNNIQSSGDVTYLIQIGRNISKGIVNVKSGYIQNLTSYPSAEGMIRTLSGELK